jgi:hypothetical protein
VLELPEQGSTRATVASVQRVAGGGASASSWSRRRPDARRWSRLQARVAGSAPECPLPCSGMPFFLSCCLTPSIPPLDLCSFSPPCYIDSRAVHVCSLCLSVIYFHYGASWDFGTMCLHRDCLIGYSNGDLSISPCDLNVEFVCNLFLLVPGTAIARRSALRTCRAAVVLRHDTARKSPLRVVLGPPLRHGGTHGTARNVVVPDRVGPLRAVPFRARVVLGPGGPFGIL